MSYRQVYKYQKRKQREQAERIVRLICIILALGLIASALRWKGGKENGKEQPVQTGASTEQCYRSWDYGNGTYQVSGTAGTTEGLIRSGSYKVGERQAELTNCIYVSNLVTEAPNVLTSGDRRSSDTVSNSPISLGDFRITAYCACSICCGKDKSDPAYGITYTGTKVKEGWTVAADPDVIPLGSVVEIDGHTYHVEDIGGAVKGNTVDIYIADHDAANEFGVQYHEVFLVEGVTECTD